MPLSKEFLPLFEKFVNNYKQKSAGSFMNLWAHEQDLCTKFEELLTILSSNLEQFNDASIIGYMNKTVLMAAFSNPILLKNWVDFMTAYYATRQELSSNSLYIPVAPESSSQQLIEQLQNSLSKAREFQQSSEVSHKTEIAILKTENEFLLNTKNALEKENALLKSQLQHEQQFKEMQPKIASIGVRFEEFSQFLIDLNQIIKEPQIINLNPEHIEPLAPVINSQPPVPPPPPPMIKVEPKEKEEALPPPNKTPSTQSSQRPINFFQELQRSVEKRKTQVISDEKKNTPI